MTLRGQKEPLQCEAVDRVRSVNCSKESQNIFEEWFVTQIPYERIVIAGKGYVSTEAIQLLTERNINVILLDSFGNLVCNMGRTTPTFRIALAMEKEECKLALKMGKIASSYRIIAAFVIM
jgi:hypothetical protein